MTDVALRGGRKGVGPIKTPELMDEIGDRIADGETLRSICRDERMPAAMTVYDWRDADPDFALRLARAREVGFDAIADEIIEISDTPDEGVEIEYSPTGTKEKRGDMLGHRRLRVHARLQLLAVWSQKYNPKKDFQEENKKPAPKRVTVEVQDASLPNAET